MPWNDWKEYVTEKSSDTTGNRSRDRPTSSAAPNHYATPSPLSKICKCIFSTIYTTTHKNKLKSTQLDATEVFIADLIACSTWPGHHYAHHQELKSIIQWLLPVVFGAVVFKLLV